MDSESIEEHIKILSKERFASLCVMILRSIFGFSVANTDAKGDGGSDYLVLSNGGGTTAHSIQRTVQDKNWESKAIDDAKKAHGNGAQRFFFLTSRSRESSQLRALEQSILDLTGVPSICLGAREIAAFIVERDLLWEFGVAIGLNLVVPPQGRVTSQGQMLHAYLLIGSDRTSFREEVYDDTIALALYSNGGTLTREELTIKTLELLGYGDTRENSIASRIDSMLTRGLLVGGKGSVTLSEKVSRRIQVSDAMYADEIATLAERQATLLEEKFHVRWNPDDSSKAAVLLSRCFIREQINMFSRAEVECTKAGLSAAVGDPETELKSLVRAIGVPQKGVRAIVSDFVEMARELTIIKKLTRAAAFVALEGLDPVTSCRVLGAHSWTQVNVTLETTVAIPFICSSLFGQTKGHFSKGGSDCISLLSNVGARLSIPWVYINECASHLLGAYDYDGLTNDFGSALSFSENAYVAHYHQLKEAGQEVPLSLRDFLKFFSRHASVVPHAVLILSRAALARWYLAMMSSARAVQR